MAVLICGFGWFVPAIAWTVIGLVWVYMVIRMIALDPVKLALYSRLRKGSAGPHWYARFLKARHGAHTVAQPVRVAG